MSAWNKAGIFAAIGVYIVVFTVATSTPWFEILRRQPFVREALYVGFGLRTFLSLLSVCAFGPGLLWYVGALGLALDALAGIGALTLARPFVQGMETLGETFFIALVDGGLMSGMFGGVVVMAYVVQRLVRRMPREGACVKCGYDLRASAMVCPECGEPISMPVKLAMRKADGDVQG